MRNNLLNYDLRRKAILKPGRSFLRAWSELDGRVETVQGGKCEGMKAQQREELLRTLKARKVVEAFPEPGKRWARFWP